MKNRHYPIKESDFIKEIKPNIVQYDKRIGRPPKIRDYPFFSAVVLLRIENRYPLGVISLLFMGHW